MIINKEKKSKQGQSRLPYFFYSGNNIFLKNNTNSYMSNKKCNLLWRTKKNSKVELIL